MAWLAHYGVPKDQWSDEARRRYDARHRGGGKTMPWDVVIRNLRNGYDAYQDSQQAEQDQRATRRWQINKVDEQRAQTAEARRRNRRGAGYYTRSKPDDGQHTTSYRKPNKTETKSRLPNKPHSFPETTGGRTARIAERAYEIVSDRYHNGKNASNDSRRTGGNLRPGASVSVTRKRRSPINERQRAYQSIENRAHRLQTDLSSGSRHVTEYGRDGQLVKQSRYIQGLRFMPKGSKIRNKNASRGGSGKNASNNLMRVKSPNESANGSAREYNYLSRRADRIDSYLRNGGRMSDYFHNGSVVKQNRYHDNSLYFIPEGPGEDAIRNKQGKRKRR